VPVELAETIVVNVLVKRERVKLFLGLLLLLPLLTTTSEIKWAKYKWQADDEKIQVRLK